MDFEKVEKNRYAIEILIPSEVNIEIVLSDPQEKKYLEQKICSKYFFPSATLYIHGILGTLIINLSKEDSLGICFLEYKEKNKIVLYSKTQGVNNRMYSSTFLYKYLSTIKSSIMQYFLGVSRGYALYLNIIGVGYKAEILPFSSALFPKGFLFPKGEKKNQTNRLKIKVGQSHDLFYDIPFEDGLQIFCIKPTLLCIYGINKQKVTQSAACIRKLKPVEIYKGKGIRFLDEKIILKEGKKK